MIRASRQPASRTMRAIFTSAALVVLSFIALSALSCLALTGAASGAPPGPIPALWSTTHPDENTWYSDSDPKMFWTPVAGAAGYSWVFNHTPTTSPAAIIDTSAVSFATSDLSVTGAVSPWAAACGDLNEDGKKDLAVAGPGNFVYVVLGHGDGTFGDAQGFATGDTPHYVVLKDVNEDGSLDAIVRNSGSGSLSVLLGNGNGTFQARTDWPMGINSASRPHGTRVEDVSGDGNLDLIATLFAEGTVAVRLGNGNGTFQAASYYPAGDKPEAVTVGDFNHDGNQDLAVANAGSNDAAPTTVSILLGTGGGAFGPQTTYEVGRRAHAIAGADFNGDGHLDLAVANFESNTVSVLLGDGTGGFPSRTDYAVGGNPFDITLKDMNGDGVADIVTDNQFLGNISLLLGRGNGTFLAATHFLIGQSVNFFAADDFNSDGHVDLALPCDKGTVVKIMMNTTGSDRTVTLAGQAEGQWYFHVAAVNFGGEVGPVSTRRVLIDVAPVTTDNAPHAWATQNVTVTLKPTDGGSGMTGGEAGTWYALDDGPFKAGTSVTVKEEGIHELKYYSKDASGNREGVKTAAVRIDRTPPATKDDAPSKWVNHAVTVTLKPGDSLSGMSGGDAGTWYSLDGAKTVKGTSIQITHNGSHLLTFHSRDAAGNVENTKKAEVLIDTKGPQTKALKAVTVRRGAKAQFRLRVNDRTPRATVSIRIYRGKTVVKVIRLGWKKTGSVQTVSWRARIAKGQYRWKVLAVDQAGNQQSALGSSRLVVK